MGFLFFHKKDLEEAGNYLKEIEKTMYKQVRDHPVYLHYKSLYLILTCQFEDAISWAEKKLEKEPDNLEARLTFLINKACLGEFGENMEEYLRKTKIIPTGRIPYYRTDPIYLSHYGSLPGKRRHPTSKWSFPDIVKIKRMAQH